jgi:hypothetical protein
VPEKTITASKLEVKGYEQLTDMWDKITREGIKGRQAQNERKYKTRREK